jgi:predicted metal-dependent hydrolase
VKYQLIRSNKKYLSLQIKNGQLIAKAPLFMPKSKIEDFINSKQQWIESKLQIKPININQAVYFLGKKYQVIKTKDNLHIQNSQIIGNIAELLDFYRQEFQQILQDLLPKIAIKHNFNYNQVRVKKLKTRWGSCSNKNNLNFNYLLIQAPIEVIQSVIIHELCHTIHKNHSQDFWSLVYKIEPNYKEYHNWLKDNNKNLLFL